MTALHVTDAPPHVRPRFTVFVPHASDLLTDRQSNGDGLVAFEIVSRLAARGHVVHAAAPAIDVSGALPSNLHLYELRSPPRGRATYALRSRLLFERVRRRARIDVIHQLNPVATGLSLALVGCGLPVVLGSFIGDWPVGRDPLAPHRRDPLLFRTVKRAVAWLHQCQADVLLVTTPAACERIVDARAAGAKIVVLPHGIDVERYAPAIAGASAGPPSILFLGGIEHRKGIFTLLDAFATVAAAQPRARLTVAGSGFLYPRLLEVVAAHPYRTRIDVLGSVPRRDVPALLQDCTVFCLPSTGEPFGMSLLEAMAAGKPVVATDAGGPRHLVESRGGYLVPPGDARALAGALNDVLAAPERQLAMGAFNRAVVERTYRWERVIERLEQIYAALIGEHA